MPGPWTGFIKNGHPIPATRWASYRLRVLLPASRPRLALRLMPVDSAYQLYINGNLLASNGQISNSAEKSRAQWLPLVRELDSSSDQLDIILQISNFELGAGGPFYESSLGESSEVHASRELGIFRDSIFAGFLLVFGLYHLALFSMRPGSPAMLYFGLACCVAAVHALAHGEKCLFVLLSTLDFELMQKINVLSGYLVLPLWIGFLHAILPREYHRRIVRLIQLISLGFILVVIFAPARIHFQTGYYCYLFNIVSIAYAVIPLCIAIYRKRDSAFWILTGVLVLLATLIHDLLFESGIIGGIPLFSPGIFAFSFIQTMALARLFSNTFIKVEKLSKELEVSNQNLRKLDRLKDDFLANTSHELHTPLNGIIGITQSILDGATGSLSPTTRHNLKLVTSSGRRLSILVNDILDFSRLQHCDFDLRVREIDLNSMIGVVVSLSRPLIIDKSIFTNF